jgi:hypothetical protein
VPWLEPTETNSIFSRAEQFCHPKIEALEL